MSIIKVPIQKDWRKAQQRLELASGITMAYQETGNTEGPVIIMAHGFSDSSRATRMISTHLQDTYHIYALDLRGHGASDKPQQYAYTSYQHMEDIVAFADGMGIDRFHLMGISMGSFAAQCTAFANPGRVDHLILVATGSKFRHTPQEVRTLLDGFAELSAGTPTLDELIPTHARFDDQDFLTEMYPEVCAWPRHCWEAGWRGMEITDNSKFLQDIQAPALCLWGTEDDVFTAEDQQIILDNLPGAKAVWLEGGSHEIQQEKHAEIAAQIQVFLNG